MSTFFGLNIARLGMQAQQKGLEVTGHNIANANTEGYSRQVAHMTPTPAIPYAFKGMLGTGVVVDEIKRIRDLFLDRQIRKEQHTLGQWETRATYLSQIEQIFMEPTENGFNAVLSSFFDSWQELSINAENSSARSALIEKANLLLNAVKHTYNSLATVRNDLKAHIEIKVEEINSLARQISDLNKQITRLETRNDQPSDLMDRRDLLLEQLAKIINFETSSNPNGSINIIIGGRTLVHENNYYELTTIPPEDSDSNWPSSPQIVWAKDERPVYVTNGEIYGLIQVRDGNLRRYMEDFESLVWAIVDGVNEYHRQGLDLEGNNGEDFFTGDHLLTLQVNNEIVYNPEKIAAAYLESGENPGGDPPYPANGANAMRIAQLRNERYSIDMTKNIRERLAADPDGSTTLELFYRDSIARLGVDGQEGTRLTENQKAMLELMTSRRLSISGVSLDEELANMVQYQLSYQACARLVTALDDIYNTLINDMIR